MLIEVYRGIEIMHNAEKDEFYTNIVVSETPNGKKDFIKSGRLQKTRTEIDKFLNTSSKKPIIINTFIVYRDDYHLAKKHEIIIYNNINNTIVTKGDENESHFCKIGVADSWRERESSFLDCKENEENFNLIKKKKDLIDKLEKEILFIAKNNLIPLSKKHII